MHRHPIFGRATMSATSVAAVLLLTLAACSDGGDDNAKTADPTRSSAKGNDKGTPSQAPEEVLAEVKGDGVTLQITSAKRDSGGFVTVEGTVTNNSSRAKGMGEWRGNESELARNAGSMAGASLVDSAGKKKYLVLRDTEGQCLCTRFTGGIDAGQTTEWFAQFPAPPEETSDVNFQVGGLPPATLSLSGGE
ncbi:hypothetical protein [Streptomyces sp. CO7]